MESTLLGLQEGEAAKDLKVVKEEPRCADVFANIFNATSRRPVPLWSSRRGESGRKALRRYLAPPLSVEHSVLDATVRPFRDTERHPKTGTTVLTCRPMATTHRTMFCGGEAPSVCHVCMRSVLGGLARFMEPLGSCSRTGSCPVTFARQSPGSPHPFRRLVCL